MISAASASIFRSTSHRETTSTGATWRSRSRSILPYQPEPISPTRFVPGAVNASAAAGSPIRDMTKPLEAAPAWRNSRRFMILLPGSVLVVNVGETPTQVRAAILACQPAGPRPEPSEHLRRLPGQPPQLHQNPRLRPRPEGRRPRRGSVEFASSAEESAFRLLALPF